MQFADLREELKSVAFEELRQDRDDYFEAVAVKNELAKLTLALEKFFGPAISPAQLPKGMENTIGGEFGGIMKGQTLYFKDQAGDKIIAMLWPWQDKEHTTVKIIKK